MLIFFEIACKFDDDRICLINKIKIVNSKTIKSSKKFYLDNYGDYNKVTGCENDFKIKTSNEKM